MQRAGRMPRVIAGEQVLLPSVNSAGVNADAGRVVRCADEFHLTVNGDLLLT